MGDKTIRWISVIVIVFCVFISGIAVGTISVSVERINENLDELKSLAGSSEMFLAGTDSAKDDEAVQGLFEPFWETWDLLHTLYVDQPLDDNAMMEGAIEGMIASLGDKHTRYSDPESYQAEIESMAGEYQGIGAYVDATGEYAEISTPIPGSPAEAAGLQPHDLIIAVNGEDMTGVDPSVTVTRMRGPEGTKVTLTIRRGDEEPFDLEIERRRIEVADVEGKMLDSGIAYIQLTQFGEKTTEQLKASLKELMSQKPTGLILDLRNNGGGFLDTCVEIASEFLPSGELVAIEIEGDGTETEYKTHRGSGKAQKIPMVILINGGSASASEILTGALRCHERAEIIGETSYGKGSVQVQPTLSNGGAVSVTIARWYTPDRVLVHGVGITPDITVELTEEDVLAQKDTQLEAAENFLLGKPIEEEMPEENL